MAKALTALVADRQPYVHGGLVRLLQAHECVRQVHAVSAGTDAVRVLAGTPVDAVFLDTGLPGLGGLDVARLVARFRTPPKVVLIASRPAHVVDEFDLRGLDYLLRPVSPGWLDRSLRRIAAEPDHPPADEIIPVELGGATRFVHRSQVVYVEAAEGYARLHTTGGTSHLIRTPLSTLERDWSDDGFIRIHRSLLVSAEHIREVRSSDGHHTVLVQGGDNRPTELPVARRHSRDLQVLARRRVLPATRIPGVHH